MTPEEAVAKLWELGDLTYKYHPTQEKMHKAWSLIPTSVSRKFVVVAGRGFRKSSWLLMLAYQEAIKYPGCDVAFVAPVEKKLEDYISPIVDFVLKDCPKNDYRPRSDNVAYVGKSRILFRGSNNKSFNDLRGGKLRLGLVDEAGYIDDLEELVDKVLMPGCIKGQGRMVLSSTPPENPEHPFEKKYCAEAESGGWYFHGSFLDAGYGEQEVLDACREAGGPDSITWLVEYLAKRGLVNTELKVVPDFDEARNVGVWAGDRRLLAHYKRHVSCDI